MPGKGCHRFSHFQFSPVSRSIELVVRETQKNQFEILKMPPVEGKIAVVTGASSGIGEAIVKTLVTAGMTVAGLARRVEKVEALAKSLSAEKGKLHAIKCDVSSDAEVKKSFNWVETNLGPPTLVVNNAGVLKMSLVSELEVNDLQVMFNTNVVGLSLCSREALSSMFKHKTEGTIININSVAGHFILPFPAVAPYNASKYAVTALTEGMRNEVTLKKGNIRVTSLSPGAVESELTDGFKSPDGKESPLDVFSMLPASDIADCVLFVAQAPQRMNISELMVLSTHETTLTQAKAASHMMENL